MPTKKLRPRKRHTSSKTVQKRTTARRSVAPSYRTKPTPTEGILALVLNIVLLPGIGTLIGRRTKEGIIQMVLVIVGIPLSFFIIGIPIVLGAWIWALVSGIQILQESQK